MKTIDEKKITQPKVRHLGIADLKKKLAGFEKRYDMPTEVFLQKVENGEMEDTHDVVRWLGMAEAYQALNQGRSHDR